MSFSYLRRPRHSHLTAIFSVVLALVPGCTPPPCQNARSTMPTVLELYEKLKPKLGEEEARSLLEFIASSVEQRAATKADLQQAVSSLREELHLGMASLREEMRQGDASLRKEIRRVESSLREEIHNVKVDLLKWSFAFWVGNVAVLSGIMFALPRGAK